MKSSLSSTQGPPPAPGRSSVITVRQIDPRQLSCDSRRNSWRDGRSFWESRHKDSVECRLVARPFERSRLPDCAAWALCGCDSGSFIPPANRRSFEVTGPAPRWAVTDSTPAATVSDVRRNLHGRSSSSWPSTTHRGSRRLEDIRANAGGPRQGQASRFRHSKPIAPSRNRPSWFARPWRVIPAPWSSSLPTRPIPVWPRPLEEAQAEGIPVVLLSRPAGDQPARTTGEPRRPVAAPKSSPRRHALAATTASSLEPQSFAESAKQLVASAIRNAKDAELDPRAGRSSWSTPSAIRSSPSACRAIETRSRPRGSRRSRMCGSRKSPRPARNS